MSAKIMILGLGSVGRSLLKILLNEEVFVIDDVMVTDSSDDALSFFLSVGGKKDNFYRDEINSTSYKKVFDRIGEGDFLICLADRNDSLIMSEDCISRGIHFISASDDQFEDLYEEKTVMYRDHFLAYKELSKGSKGKATGVIQFGMNPGLVNVFTKIALRNIVENDEGELVSARREYLKKLIKNEQYALLAKELRVSAFIESDYDTTESDIKEDPETVYSTWNIYDFVEEMNSRSLLKVGTETPLSAVLDKFRLSTDKIYYYNRKDGTLVLDESGKNVRTVAHTRAGSFEGCVDVHEEVFSIQDYYTIRNEDGEIEYAPTVMFVYHPCDLALRSVFHASNSKEQIIGRDRVLSGGEAVGICAEGDGFSPVLVEVALSCDNLKDESPTVYPVAASLFAAIRYIMNHPAEGILFPEYTDPEEIISYVSKLLPVVITRI